MTPDREPGADAPGSFVFSVHSEVRSHVILRLPAFALLVLLGSVLPPAASAGARQHGGPAIRCATTSTGRIVYSDWQFPDSLDPYRTQLATSQLTLDSTFEGLFRFGARGKLIPRIATQLPSIGNEGLQNGGRTILLALRPGFRWSNGAPVTSADLKFGWKVDSDPATGPRCAGSCDVISSIDTPDRYTALLRLKRVDAAAIPNALPDLWPRRWGTRWNGNPHAAAVALTTERGLSFEEPNAPTNGPFRVVSFVRDDRIVLRPMRYYPRPRCAAPPRELIFAFYAGKASMIAAAERGETDVTGGGGGYTVADLPALRAQRRVRVHVAPGYGLEHLELNHDPTVGGKPNPLARADVRVALALALDKLGTIRGALGASRATARGIEASTFLVRTPRFAQPFAARNITGQWDPLARRYLEPGTALAVRDARRLLTRTPYRHGLSLSLITTTGNAVRTAEMATIAASLRRNLGVRVTTDAMPAGRLFAPWEQGGVLARGQFQLALDGFTGGPEPDAYRYQQGSAYIARRRGGRPCTVCGNDSAIDDPTIDRAYDRAVQSFDPRVRARWYAVIQRETNRKAHWIPLYYRPAIATDDGRVARFANNPSALGPEWNTWQWRVLKG